MSELRKVWESVGVFLVRRKGCRVLLLGQIKNLVPHFASLGDFDLVAWGNPLPLTRLLHKNLYLHLQIFPVSRGIGYPKPALIYGHMPSLFLNHDSMLHLRHVAFQVFKLIVLIEHHDAPLEKGLLRFSSQHSRRSQISPIVLQSDGSETIPGHATFVVRGFEFLRRANAAHPFVRLRGARRGLFFLLQSPTPTGFAVPRLGCL